VVPRPPESHAECTKASSDKKRRTTAAAALVPTAEVVLTPVALARRAEGASARNGLHNASVHPIGGGPFSPNRTAKRERQAQSGEGAKTLSSAAGGGARAEAGLRAVGAWRQHSDP
jgi:hypothetical protein